MYVTRVWAAGLTVALICLTGRTHACEDVAVISRDARFIVLSSDDLSIADVGNLWWLGIRIVDGAIPGSTLARSGLGTESLVDVTTGLLKPERGYLVILSDLGRQLRSPAEMTSEPESGSVIKRWWVNGADPDRLIRIQRQAKNEYSLTLLNDELQDIAKWPIVTPDLGLGAACADDRGRIIVGGLKSRLVYSGNDFVVNELAPARTAKQLKLTDITLGCKAVMIGIEDDYSSRKTVGIFDLARNELTSTFETKRDTLPILFSNAERLLEQDINLEPVANTVGYKANPTARFRVVDGRNGRVIKESELKAGATTLLSCSANDEKAIIAEGNRVHLVDLETLSIIGSREIPFERYFVL